MRSLGFDIPKIVGSALAHGWASIRPQEPFDPELTATQRRRAANRAAGLTARGTPRITTIRGLFGLSRAEYHKRYMEIIGKNNRPD